MSTDEYSGTRWRHIFSHVSGASVAKKGNGECTMSNPAIQNNANDIKNSIVNIWNILYVFKYLSNFIPHLDQIYTYIYIPLFIFSITTFLLHWLTHTLPRNKILFFLHPDMRRVIYLLQEFQKKKNKNRISSKSKIIFSHLTKPL